jgi:hypothetical protein
MEAIERIKPGHPQQNGRHECMHPTLKKEATRLPGMNSLQQQGRFDAFVGEFNTECPHEALAMKTPSNFTRVLLDPMTACPPRYPLHDRDVAVSACGCICMHRKRMNLSRLFAGQRVGIKDVDQRIWIVSSMHYDLGYIDPGAEDPATAGQPVRLAVVTYVSGTACHPRLRAAQ